MRMRPYARKAVIHAEVKQHFPKSRVGTWKSMIDSQTSQRATTSIWNAAGLTPPEVGASLPVRQILNTDVQKEPSANQP